MKKSTIPKVNSEKELFEALYKQMLKDGKLMPLGRFLAYAAELYPDNTALIFKDHGLTYRDLYYRTALFSIKLHEKGVNPHDRVILLFENSIEFFIGYYAIAQLGAVVVPLNIFLHEKEFAYIITNAQPQCIVASKEFVEKLAAIEEISLPCVFTQDDMELTQLAPATLPEVPFFDLEPDDMALLLYTSGTTGFPKGVMLSSRNCLTNVIQSIARIGIGLDPNERIFAVLPLFHSFAQNTCVWAGIISGSTIILVPRIERRAILEGLKHKPTIFLGVPALYGLLCLLKTAPIDGVKFFASGGDALPDKINTAFELIYRRKICSGYGLTETAPVISIELTDELRSTNTVGAPLVGIELLLKDEQGNPITQTGRVGELWVKGDNVMLGYYQDPEKTQEIIQNGWLATGDLAYFDEQRRLVITGRTKDLIIHKGFNIYPQEIENVLISHPLVMRVGVIGKDDYDVGQVPIAFVQLTKDQTGIEEQLKDLCVKNLANYKIPREFICSTKELPVTATGKVDKKQLRALIDKGRAAS